MSRFRRLRIHQERAGHGASHGIVLLTVQCYQQKNKRRYSEYTSHVFGFGDTRREATLLYWPVTTKNKRRYSEYTLRVFGCGDTRREVTSFIGHQKQEKIQRIHAPCIRVRGRAERSYFVYCPPKTIGRYSEYNLSCFRCWSYGGTSHWVDAMIEIYY